MSRQVNGWADSGWMQRWTDDWMDDWMVSYDKQVQIPPNRQGLGLGPKLGLHLGLPCVPGEQQSPLVLSTQPSAHRATDQDPCPQLEHPASGCGWSSLAPPGPRPRRPKNKGLLRKQAGLGVRRPWSLTLLGAAELCPPSCPATSLPKVS